MILTKCLRYAKIYFAHVVELGQVQCVREYPYKGELKERARMSWMSEYAGVDAHGWIEIGGFIPCFKVDMKHCPSFW